MPQFIDLPDGTVGEFPDDMSDEAIVAVLRRQFPPGTPVIAPQEQATQDPGEDGFLTNLAKEALGGIDTAAALGSGIASEVASGIGGLAKSITSGSEAGEETQKQISQALTFTPRSEKGQRNIQAIGKALDPVIKGLEAVRAFLGDTALALTGSPGIATAFSILPDLALEVIPAKAILVAGKGRNLGKIRKESKKLKAKETLAVNKGVLIKGAPTPKKLFETSSRLYDEVDAMGATLKKFDYNKFADDMNALKAELDIELNPEISRILDIIEDGRIKTLTVKQMDNIRKKTVTALQKSSKSGVDKRAAKIIQNGIDNLIGDVGALDVPKGIKPSDVSLRLKTARKLWGRGRRAETVNKAIEKAAESDNPVQALKTAFTKLLKDDVDFKQFNPAEKKVLRDFTKPGSKVNILRIASNFGLDIDRPGSLSNFLALGLGGGTAAGVGIETAIAVGTAGTLAKASVKKIMQKKADFANAIFAAGPDAGKITKAYLRVPKNQRKAGELAELLMLASKETIDKLPNTEFIRKAKAIVESRSRAGALAAPAPLLGAESDGEITLRIGTGAR